ncbi:MAG: reverse transcriptase family protein [Bacteroidales bacterium]|nr:reverse transcriptase family protein [Bacteroidales bacterium]
MSKKHTKKQILNKAAEFSNCKNIKQVSFVLKVSPMQLATSALLPQYYYFKMKKLKGGFRNIEAPEPPLKKLQRKLNTYLQYCYYSEQTKAAYGFIINPRKQKAKNIVSNAQQHKNNSYMLNIDFDDFFHQISIKEVIAIFRKSPFNFNKNTAGILSKICTNKGRLPMGAPTSPVLSNFACSGLDKELQQWADTRIITYTRFVDDLTFSSNMPITKQHYNEIKEITDKYDFQIETTKTKWYGKEQEKTVTGLTVGETIAIPEAYYTELDKDLHRLQKTTEVHIITGQVYKADAGKKFKQEIMGKINFIAVVHGYDGNKYETYMQKYEDAINPPDKDELSMRWLRFSNYMQF